MTKKIIEDKKDLVHLDIDMEVIPLEELSDLISGLIEEYGKDAYIDKEYYGYDGAYDLYLYFERMETDKEYADRLKKEERGRSNISKKYYEEYKEYQRLKKKFGDSE